MAGFISIISEILGAEIGVLGGVHVSLGFLALGYLLFEVGIHFYHELMEPSVVERYLNGEEGIYLTDEGNIVDWDSSDREDLEF